MSIGVALIVFVVCLVITLGGSEVLVRGVDRIGVLLSLSAGLIGLCTALGADSPEISSALVALVSGARDVGTGVIFGSNIFNLAALLGVSAVVATRVEVGHDELKLHGGVALLVTLLIAAFVLRLLSPLALMALLLAVLIPYVAVLALRPQQIARLPGPLRALLAPFALCTEKATTETTGDEDDGDERADHANRSAEGVWRPALQIGLALMGIVGGSIGLVRATLTLAGAWGVPRGLVGVLILAALTGLPNAYAAVRLARRGRGSEVVSEAFNSNTVNLLIGIGLPALLVGLGRSGPSGEVDLAWLLGMTVLVLPLLARRGGLTRPEGGLVAALYVAFVLVRVLGPGL